MAGLAVAYTTAPLEGAACRGFLRCPGSVFVPDTKLVPPSPLGWSGRTARLSQASHHSCRVKTPAVVLKTLVEVFKTPAVVFKTPAEVLKTPAVVFETPAEVFKTLAVVFETLAEVSNTLAVALVCVSG